MTKINIDMEPVKDWDSFHDKFAEVFGFPDFYGRNMNAWVDCMSDLSGPRLVGMSKVEFAANEDVLLCIKGMDDFGARCPDVLAAFLLATSQVNVRMQSSSGGRRLLLLLV